MNLTIRRQLVLLAILPLIVVSLVISFLLTSSRIGDAEKSVDAKAKLLLNQLSNISEFSFYTGNDNELLDLARSALVLPEVVSIEITNTDGNRIVFLSKVKDINPN